MPDTTAVVKDAASYIGLYPLSPVFAIAITEENGVLYGQPTNQMSLKLRRVAPDRFSVVSNSVTAAVVFMRDAAGSVNGLVLTQSGLERHGPRRELPQWPKEVTLPVEVLREYVGTYPRAPGVTLTVTMEGGKLYTQVISQASAQVPSQPKHQIFPSTRDEFFSKLTDARFSFERDTTGRVIGFVLHQRMLKLPETTGKE